ncbi:MAG: methyl-accepting chemotaxis protein [Deltaproteobacteria bacterium]
MKMSIRYKAFLPLAIIVIVIGCGLGVTMWSIRSQMKYSTVVNIAGRQRMLTQKMSKDALALTLGVEEARGRLEKSSNEFEAVLNALINGGVLTLEGIEGEVVLPSTKDEAILEQMKKVAGLWAGFYADVKVMLNKDSDLQGFASAAKRVEADNTTLLKEVATASNMYTARGTRSMESFMRTQVVFFVLTMGMAAVGWYVFRRIIVNPVSKVTEFAKALSEGDLGAMDIEIKSNDEMQTLAEALNAMKQSLNAIIGKLKATSDEITAISGGFLEQSREIVRGAERQSESTGQVAESMEEMSSTVIEVAKNSRSASESSDEARQTAIKGGEVVKTAVDGMSTVAETVNECTRKVEALGQSSNQVGAIVAVINDIADQTNLLALNAAIEAARAGEQGRGFAVVADEVRKLAEKTTKATKEIAAMIKSIQADTKAAIEAMKKGNSEAEQGMRLAENSGKVLIQIVENVEKVSDMLRQNATATEEQSAAVDGITNNINGIADIARGTTAGIKQMAESTENLNRVAEELNALVGTFRLSRDAVSEAKPKRLSVVKDTAA